MITVGALFYFLAAIVLLAVGFKIIQETEFDAWKIAGGLALLGVIFSGVALPNMVVRKSE